jgi:hypothetical protein
MTGRMKAIWDSVYSLQLTGEGTKRVHERLRLDMGRTFKNRI